MRTSLDLSRHCIETEIRKRHNRCISRYFKRAGDIAATEDELKLMEAALATLDFGCLRSRHPALSGHTDASVILGCGEGGQLNLWVDGTPVDISAAHRRGGH